MTFLWESTPITEEDVRLIQQMDLTFILYREAFQLQVKLCKIYYHIGPWQIKGMIEAGRVQKSAKGWRLDGRLL